MDKRQLKELVGNVLLNAGLYSDNAVDLLMETAAVESNLGQYIRQLKGPALGIFQMEPNTEADIWENYICYRDGLKRMLMSYGYVGCASEKLYYDLQYQVLMARIHYLRVKAPIPDTVEERAKYWKQYYNTVNGKGSAEKYLLAVDLHINQ